MSTLNRFTVFETRENLPFVHVCTQAYAFDLEFLDSIWTSYGTATGSFVDLFLRRNYCETTQNLDFVVALSAFLFLDVNAV